MTQEIRFILIVLAVYRLADLVALDDGPYYVFQKIRLFLARRASDNPTWNSLADLVHCPYCVGVWFSAVGVITLIYPSMVTDIVIIWLAIAGFQSFMESLVCMRKK